MHIAFKSLAVGVLLLSGAALVPASAQQASAPLADWESLTPAQRDTLVGPLRTRWDEASPEERTRLWQHAHRWQSLTPEQRSAARKGAQRWEHMSPHKRDRAMRMFNITRSMTDEQRRAFKQQWRQMTPEQRRAWLDRHSPPPTRSSKGNQPGAASERGG